MTQRNIIKGKPLNFNVGLQRWYVRELTKLVDDLTKAVYNEIKPLYGEYKSQITFDASISSQTRIVLNKLRQKYDDKFHKRGKKLAEEIIKKINRYANNTFSLMLKQMLKMDEPGAFLLKGSIVSPEKEEVIKSLVYENVSKITNIPTRYFEQITGAVMRSIQAGKGLTEIEKELLKYHKMTKDRAKLIAQDQTRKAYNSINLRNMQEAGIKKFEWLHSGGSQKPRKYHQENYPKGLNHGVFDLDKGAPSEDGKRYIYPGEEPYCHCRMAAVLDFDFN